MEIGPAVTGFDVSMTGPCLVVAARGEVDAAAAPRMREAVLQALQGEVRHVVVDMSGLEFIDSTGLGVLIALQHRLGPGTVALAAPPRLVTRLLEVTGLRRLFPVFDSVEEALASVASG